MSEMSHTITIKCPNKALQFAETPIGPFSIRLAKGQILLPIKPQFGLNDSMNSGQSPQ